MSELTGLRAALKVSNDPDASMEEAARADAIIEEVSPELLEALIALADQALSMWEDGSWDKATVRNALADLDLA